MARRKDTISPLLTKIIHDIRALDSNVRLLAQQIRVMKKTDRILARNLILLNRKIKEAREVEQKGVPEEALREIRDEISGIKEEIAKMRDDIDYLKRQLQHTLTSEDIAELKYIVTTINPLEFVTYKQIGELVEKKLKELGVIK